MMHVLVVDDSLEHASIVVDALRYDAHVTVQRDVDGAARYLGIMEYDAVISDLSGVSNGRTPHATAARLASAIRAACAHTGASRPAPLILTSALDPLILDGIAGSLPHTHALPKPFSPVVLRALVVRLTDGASL